MSTLEGSHPAGILCWSWAPGFLERASKLLKTQNYATALFCTGLPFAVTVSGADAELVSTSYQPLSVVGIQIAFWRQH